MPLASPTCHSLAFDFSRKMQPGIRITYRDSKRFHCGKEKYTHRAKMVFLDAQNVHLEPTIVRLAPSVAAAVCSVALVHKQLLAKFVGKHSELWG